ncbi:SDR family oxidoreductase [Gammaproteobacteria bacterium]|nr:SDR family oxidoreductase [Gammaproteobacteria bacterium]MDC0223159.1 SDR family oxidoreductase [Gammaproteobacteria bacterium]|tara:strand:- start:724 stop:1581 length:858 start_codon:yes stop_codon:yes gene_type:complete
MILLTGATGKTGSATAKALNEKGITFRALIRNEEKRGDIESLGGEVVIGSIENKEAVDQSMVDVETALILLPNSENQLSLEKQLVDSAKQAGAKRVVKMSSIEATPDATSPIPKLHLESEEYIKQSGLSWTMIKPNFYMQNLLASAGTIKDQGKIFLPMGEGKTGMIDTTDVGKVLAKVLSEDGHESMNHEITGPEILSFNEVAEIFSKGLDKQVDYVDVPLAAYKETLGQFLTNQWHLDAVIDLFKGIADGGIEEKTDTYSELMGESPKSLSEFISENSFIFKS